MLTGRKQSDPRLVSISQSVANCSTTQTYTKQLYYFASGMKLSAVLLLALIMYVFALAAEGKPAPGRGRPVLPSKRLGQMAAYR